MRDFSCCGKTLPRLHDLLQHYEECHAQQTPQSLRTATTVQQANSTWKPDKVAVAEQATTSAQLQTLEANFLRDFSCCWQTFPTLHDLLQHYEECHAQQTSQSLRTATTVQQLDATQQPNKAAVPKQAAISVQSQTPEKLACDASSWDDLDTTMIEPIQDPEALQNIDMITEPTSSFIINEVLFVPQLPQVPPNRPRTYSEQEWEQQRETFKRLYVLEDRPLKEVSKILKDEFGFHAT